MVRPSIGKNALAEDLHVQVLAGVCRSGAAWAYDNFSEDEPSLPYTSKSKACRPTCPQGDVNICITEFINIRVPRLFICSCRAKKNQGIAIENLELMHECCPQHLRMGAAGINVLEDSDKVALLLHCSNWREPPLHGGAALHGEPHCMEEPHYMEGPTAWRSRTTWRAQLDGGAALHGGPHCMEKPHYI